MVLLSQFMRSSDDSRKAAKKSRSQRQTPSKWRFTIHGYILQSFVAIAAVTTVLSAGSAYSVMKLGAIATKTFDESLMSVSFARKAATDFAKIDEAILALQLATSNTNSASLLRDIRKNAQALHEDLIIARDRSQSTRAKASIDEALKTLKITDINNLAREVSTAKLKYDYKYLQKLQSQLSLQLNYVVNYVAGDAFDYKLKSLKVQGNQLWLNIALAVAVMLFTALILLRLARRISYSVAGASAFALTIANGNLESKPPAVTADELGDLTLAMVRMREKIRASLRREAESASDAKSILADTLAMLPDGIMVQNSAGDIILTNRQMETFARETIAPGEPIDGWAPRSMEGGTERLLAQLNEKSQLSNLPFRHGDGWLRLSTGETRSGGRIFVCADVTSLKSQEQKLTDSHRWLDVALENMARGLCLYDPAGHLVVVNKTFLDIYGLTPDDVRLGDHYDTVARVLATRLVNSHPMLASEPHSVSLGYQGLNRDDMILCNGSVCRVTKKNIDNRNLIEIHEDITEAIKVEQRLYDMSHHDGLTGLANRVLFAEHISHAISRVEQGEGFSLLCLDLDLFKDVNDTFGHPVGDALLCAVSGRIRACLRPCDVAGRLGGDEFAVILRGLTSQMEIEAIAERLVSSLGASFNISGHHITIGASVGISIAPEDGNDGEKLLQKADAALYLAKTHGRGAWRFYDAVMDHALRERRSLDADLRLAISRDELEVHYQPIYSVANGSVTSFEALLRWRHPQRGMVPPSEFIPLAEETGLIFSLGEWVLRTACTEANTWPGKYRLSVNLSLAQLRPGNFLHILATCLNDSGFNPARLDLEITESIFLEKNTYALNILQDVRKQGVTISLDDFGTGYSSLSYLGRFPFDRIKIDRSFVQNLLVSDQSKVVVEAVLLISSRYNMRITAEGVETPEQFEWLRQAKCDEMQGYLIGKPMPAAEALRHARACELPQNAPQLQSEFDVAI